MINGYQSKLLDIYSKIREEEANFLKERKNTIKALLTNNHVLNEESLKIGKTIK